MSLPIKIKLPEHFLESEVRCGYEVSAKLKKVWAVELDLLAEFDRVCAKHCIKYQVFAGTLLGAVRHKGFIPWDDDVDVALLREDYDRLLAVSSEFKHPYFLQTAYSDPLFFITHSRLRNSETTGAIAGEMDVRYNNGIYIDVFVLDDYTESSVGYKTQKAIIRFLGAAISGKKNVHKEHKVSTKLFVRRLVSALFFMFPASVLLYLRDVVVKINNWHSGPNRRVGLVSHINWFTEKYWLRNCEARKSVRYNFENIQVYGPLDYDTVLTRIYGDYMCFPPVEERGKWHEGKIHFEPDVPYIEYLKGKQVVG